MVWNRGMRHLINSRPYASGPVLVKARTDLENVRKDLWHQDSNNIWDDFREIGAAFVLFSRSPPAFDDCLILCEQILDHNSYSAIERAMLELLVASCEQKQGLVIQDKGKAKITAERNAAILAHPQLQGRVVKYHPGNLAPFVELAKNVLSNL